MQHRITQQVKICPLDSFLNVREHGGPDTPYQLEVSHSDKSPKKNIGAISHYSGKYSYTIGAHVDVKLQVSVNMGCWLTNIIMNQCLIDYVRGQ